MWKPALARLAQSQRLVLLCGSSCVQDPLSEAAIPLSLSDGQYSNWTHISILCQVDEQDVCILIES